MTSPSAVDLGIPLSWRQAVQNKVIRHKLIIAHILLVSAILTLPHFFDFIEQREGVPLMDPLLNYIPSMNVSLPIFVCIWGTTALLLYRCVSDPNMYLRAIFGFVIIIFVRIITITLVPLEPPTDLIPLIDPISNIAYGRADFITKDLFFSGHTSSQFLAFLCLNQGRDKTIALVSTLLVGAMVLLQHVHYSIDVIAAPVFTYFCYWLGSQITIAKWPKVDLNLPKELEVK